MAETLTPEKVMEYGKRIRELIIETGTPEQRLAGLSPDEVLPRFSPDERLAGLSPDERLAGLNSAERRQLLRRLQEEFDAADGDENS